MKRLLHWGPFLALFVIGYISINSMNCILMWWPPLYNIYSFLHLLVFLWWNVTILYNFFNAVFIGPGLVPLGWKPQLASDEEYLQYCNFCKGYKAPRSHHCRKCNRCIMKMDHHCPWINNCVGHRNHASFTYFLFFAPCGCIHSLCVLIPTMYRAVYRNYYLHIGSETLVYLSVRHFIACMFAVGLAIGVTFAVGTLFVIQVKAILKNETGIESWIIEKASYREKEGAMLPEEKFIFPYNLGYSENWKMIFSWNPKYKFDGIWWPIKENCNQYTLTIEQIKQKKDKKERCITYVITEEFAGTCCPITKGFKVSCCIPMSDEPHIPLEIGNQVSVSRWRKHWLYGEIHLSEDSKNTDIIRLRGWFPRRCAKEMIDSDERNDAFDENTKGYKKNL